jgi:hypothetical protein
MTKAIKLDYLTFLCLLGIFLFIYSLYEIILRGQLSVGNFSILFVSFLLIIESINKKFTPIVLIITGILILIVTILLAPVEFYYGLIVSITFIILGILRKLNYIH